MPVTSEQTEAKDFVGSTVETPDGLGEVTAVTERYVKVKLADGRLSEFGLRDVTFKSHAAKAEPAPAAPPAPPAPPAETPAPEAPAQ